MSQITLDSTRSDEIRWSFGKNQYDNQPTNFSGSWLDFIEFCEANKAPSKGLNYITPAFANDGRRCLLNASTRDFIALDMDGNLPDDRAANLVDFFSSLKAFCYETASSLPGARRYRFIIKTDRPVTKDESKIVSKFIEALSPESESFDPCTHGIVQPIYLPPINKAITSFDGEHLFVDPILKLTPQKPQRILDRTEKDKDQPDAVAFFERNGLILNDCQFGGLDVICLWADGHTKGDITGTVLYEPDASNSYVGGYKCQHHHCEGRDIGDVYRFIRGTQWE